MPGLRSSGEHFGSLMLRLDYAERASGFRDPASDWPLAISDLHDRIVFHLIMILVVGLTVTLQFLSTDLSLHFPLLYICHPSVPP
jgi:hypothetical protein